MMSNMERKIVCHAKGHRCFGCAHYHGKTDVCTYAPITTEPKTFGQITKEGVEGAESIRRKELEAAMSDTESKDIIIVEIFDGKPDCESYLVCALELPRFPKESGIDDSAGAWTIGLYRPSDDNCCGYEDVANLSEDQMNEIGVQLSMFEGFEHNKWFWCNVLKPHDASKVVISRDYVEDCLTRAKDILAWFNNDRPATRHELEMIELIVVCLSTALLKGDE